MILLVSGTTKTMARLAPGNERYLGHLLTPNTGNSVQSMLATGLLWGVDNGAFSGFDPVAFRSCLARVRCQPRLLWIVCPDRVGSARETALLFAEWRTEVAAAGPVAYVIQDGSEDFPPPWDDFSCLFIGGTTKFKLSRCAADLTHEAKQRGKWVHMGRVNSKRRFEIAARFGCDSIDGSSASMFGDTLIPKYLRWLKAIDHQPPLF